jgi:hypothetical protein
MTADTSIDQDVCNAAKSRLEGFGRLDKERHIPRPFICDLRKDHSLWAANDR